jgi:DNA ligase-1
MKLPTLYKRSSKGATQVWNICVQQSTDGFDVVTEYGQEDGKMQVSRVKITKGKNIGRGNETTAEEQAVSEAKSKWNKQLDKGYSQNGPAEFNLLPMLAQDYTKQGKKIVFPSFYQPKLDGFRCLARYENGKVVLTTRNGKIYEVVPHIEEALLEVFKYVGHNYIFDGEIYRHGWKFQDIVKAAKRKTPTAKSHQLQYHIYDIADASLTFAERHERIEKFLVDDIKLYPQIADTLFPVDTFVCESPDEIIKALDIFLSQKYEGIILRNAAGKYEFDHRSYDLQKLKKFMDDDFEIVSVNSGKGKFEDLSIFVCKTDSGALFNCVPKGTTQERTYWKENAKDIIGKKLTVRFFEWSTSKPKLPRFPVGIAIRDYE